MNCARHDPDLAFAGADQARTIGPDQPDRASFQSSLCPRHVQHRYAFGDADDGFDASVDRLQDGVRGKGRRDENKRDVGLGGANRVRNRVEDGQAQMLGSALAGRHPRNDLAAVFHAQFCVEGAGSAGEADKEPIINDALEIFGGEIEPDRKKPR